MTNARLKCREDIEMLRAYISSHLKSLEYLRGTTTDALEGAVIEGSILQLKQMQKELLDERDTN